MPRQSVFDMPFAKVYDCLIQKAERKGRTKAEVDEVTTWLTGYESVDACSRELMRTPTAALLRKVLPSGGDYEKSGWRRLQIDNV